MNTGISAINEQVQRSSAFVRPLFSEIGKVIVGQNYLVERLVIGLLANGHVLLEGVPGLAKTLSVKALASRHQRQIFPAPIHPGPSSRRPDRHADLQSADRRVYDPARPHFCQSGPGRRNKSRAGQGAKRAARSDAGETSHHWRPNLQAGGAVSGAGHAESHRTGRHLPACPKRRWTGSC